MVVKSCNRAYWPGFYLCAGYTPAFPASRAAGMRAVPAAVDGKTYMWEELGKAFCLMLVLEGILPFLYPGRWRALVAALATVSDRQLRITGLASMLTGAGLLFLLN